MPPLDFTIVELAAHLLAGGTLHVVTCDERILTLVSLDMSHFNHFPRFGFLPIKEFLLLLPFP